MRCCQSEPTLDQLLADPLIEAVMKADRINRDEAATMLRSVAKSFAPDQARHGGSVISRLVEMLAAYYGAALCGCMEPDNQFRTCKAS